MTGPGDVRDVSTAAPSSAVEKAVALMSSIDGDMGAPCPVCRGGWWFKGENCISGVHASECPYSGVEPTREEALAHGR